MCWISCRGDQRSPLRVRSIIRVIVRKALHPLRRGRRPRRPACRHHTWCIPAGCPEAIPYGCIHACHCEKRSDDSGTIGRISVLRQPPASFVGSPLKGGTRLAPPVRGGAVRSEAGGCRKFAIPPYNALSLRGSQRRGNLSVKIATSLRSSR